MTDDVRNLIRFVVDGDIRNAQTQCRIMLEKNVPEKDAQYRILTEKCKTAKTEEDAFAVISCLETQPQTVRKLLFAKECFRDVYMLLNDADRMFADILISDCAGCVKLLKSLQKEVEGKA